MNITLVVRRLCLAIDVLHDCFLKQLVTKCHCSCVNNDLLDLACAITPSHMVHAATSTLIKGQPCVTLNCQLS